MNCNDMCVVHTSGADTGTLKKKGGGGGGVQPLSWSNRLGCIMPWAGLHDIIGWAA